MSRLFEHIAKEWNLNHRCEWCHEWPQLGACIEEEDGSTRYYNVPPWCEHCLETIDWWEEYWLAQLKQDYEKGKLQS